MNILVIYIISLLGTLGINFTYKMRVIKKLADMGKKQRNGEFLPKLRPMDLVIGLNVISAIKRLVKTDFSQIDRIEDSVDMTDEELFYYRITPNFFNAIYINENVSILSDEDRVRQKEIRINEDNKIVYYKDTLENNSKYVIISASGELLKSLTNEEKLDIVNEYHDYVNRCLNAYVDEFYHGDEEALEYDLMNGKFDYVAFKEKTSKVYGISVEKRLKK